MILQAILKYAAMDKERDRMVCAFELPPMHPARLEEFIGHVLRVRFSGGLDTIDWVGSVEMIRIGYEPPHFDLAVPLRQWPEGRFAKRDLLRKSVRVEIERMQQDLFREDAQSVAAFTNQRYRKGVRH